VARSGGLVLGIGGAIVLAGLAVGVVRYVGAAPFEQDAEGALAAGTLAAVVATPGLLALLAARSDRPSLLLPAAIVLVPLSMLSFAGILLPLLVPAVLLFRAWAPRARGRDVGVAIVVVGLLCLAVWAAFLAHDDPRSYAFGSTSDVVTYAESGIALALVAAALAVGAWATAATGSADGGDLPSGLPVSS